jgi:hypothetical protein
MNHLSQAELLALREPGREPGDADARAHLDGCPDCQREYESLHQRVARLRALPALRPSRNQWHAVEKRLAEQRRHRNRRRAAIGGLALAASVVLAVVAHDLVRPKTVDASQAIAEQMDRSQALERTLERYHGDSRVLDGLTAGVADRIESRIGAIDRQLETAQLLDQARQQEELLRLWRERNGLLDALVDVHLTRASNVGL